MIKNATLNRIDLPDAADAMGQRSWITGATVAVRCAVCLPSRQQKWQLGATIADASAVIYLPGMLPAELPQGSRLVATVDFRPSVTYEVIRVLDQMKNGMAHLEAFLQEVTT